MGSNRKRAAGSAALEDVELGGARDTTFDDQAHTVADPFYPGLREFLQTPRGREVALGELSQMLELAREAQRSYDAAYGEGARMLFGTSHEWNAALSMTRKLEGPPRDVRLHVLELVKTIKDTVVRVQNGLRNVDDDGGISRLELVRESIAEAQRALVELTMVVDATLLHSSTHEAESANVERSGVIELDAHR